MAEILTEAGSGAITAATATALFVKVTKAGEAWSGQWYRVADHPLGLTVARQGLDTLRVSGLPGDQTAVEWTFSHTPEPNLGETFSNINNVDDDTIVQQLYWDGTPLATVGVSPGMPLMQVFEPLGTSEHATETENGTVHLWAGGDRAVWVDGNPWAWGGPEIQVSSRRRLLAFF